jgi:uncharacterized protein (DUF1800 family)
MRSWQEESRTMPEAHDPEDSASTLLEAPLRRPRRAGSRPAATPGAGTFRNLADGGMSRRHLFAGLAGLGAAGTGLGAVVLSGAQTGGAAAGQGAAQAAADGALNLSQASKPAAAGRPKKKPFALPKNLDPDLLISRATYGRTAALEKDVERLGMTKWLNAQLAPAKLKDAGGSGIDARYPRLKWSAPTARKNLKEGSWDLMQDTVAAHLGRAVWSSRQLQEVMVDLWANHLNITCPSGDVWDSRHRYQIDVIRKHALGKFETMLAASAFHPAMLVYLNNAQSTGQQPNENYSRELLELHTVGVNGGYTERDVQRGALLLTGWVVEGGKAHYDPSRHYTGAVKVMGYKARNATAAKGPAAMRSYLNYLAHHPKTARHIATKLVTHFVSDNPPAGLVTRLAKTYRKHDTAIVPMLRELFASREFAESGGEKVRRPMEHLVATARVLGVKPGAGTKGIQDLTYMLGDMGHAPLARATPDGYPDVAATWQSPAAALAKFNSTATMVHGWWPNALALPGPKKLLGANPPNTRAAVITAVGRKVFGRKATRTEATAARTLLAGTRLPSSFRDGTWEQQETIALTATLFLSAPAHALR